MFNFNYHIHNSLSFGSYFGWFCLSMFKIRLSYSYSILSTDNDNDKRMRNVQTQRTNTMHVQFVNMEMSTKSRYY